MKPDLRIVRDDDKPAFLAWPGTFDRNNAAKGIVSLRQALCWIVGAVWLWWVIVLIIGEMTR